ncbi:MAG TPA: hypothetical protein VGF04_05865 [Solirubrobacterales bacterium]
MRPRAKLALTLTTSALAIAVVMFTASAVAERSQEGNLIVSLDGGISPRALPRDHVAPVAVHLAGGIHTSDSSPLPRVDRLKLELAWRGILSTRGLPECPQGRLRGADSRQAAAACHGALVGSGQLYAKIFVPNQAPFGIHARLLAFNGHTAVGRHAVLIHAFTKDPPIAFVIPFSIRRQKGTFRTVLVATIKRAVGTWPHVGSFRIDVSRTFRWHGEEHSYLSASCPVPRRFTAGFLSFARATYTFADGDELTTESVRSCRAR